MSSPLRRTALWLWALAAPVLALADEAAVDRPGGAIRGALADAAGRAESVAGNVVVFLLDGKSGMPLLPTTHQPIALDDGENIAAFDRYWHALTDAAGAFQFEDVPPGEYRLVAQSWDGVTGMARGLPKSLRSDPGDEPSNILQLHGVAEAVVVAADQETPVQLQPLGAGTLHIVTDPEEPHNFILVSRHAPLRGGIAGPCGWGPDFIAGLIGVTRMESPELTLRGLPEGETVHVALFNYDNSAGLGGESYQVGERATVRLPIYAAWSNGKFDPSADLLPLVEYMEANKLRGRQLIDPAGNLNGADYLQWMWQHAADEVAIPGFGAARMIDVSAAEAHCMLRRSHRQRIERQQQRAAQAPTK